MPNPEPTLADLFPVPPEELSERLSAAIGSAQGDAKGWTAPVRRMLVEEAARRFGDMLDIRLTDVIAGAWCKYASLLQYADPQQYPADESVLVPLAEHDIDSKHSPAIEIFVNNTPVLHLTFSVDFVLSLKGAILRIQDARIREIRTGEVKARGAITFGPIVIAERESGAFALPGSMDLGEGIAIRRYFHTTAGRGSPRPVTH
jgi:hypothetical protein